MEKKILIETDWGALLHSIHQGNCILMLGPNIEYMRDNGNEYDITIAITRLILEQETNTNEEPSPEDELLIPFI